MYYVPSFNTFYNFPEEEEGKIGAREIIRPAQPRKNFLSLAKLGVASF